MYQGKTLTVIVLPPPPLRLLRVVLCPVHREHCQGSLPSLYLHLPQGSLINHDSVASLHTRSLTVLGLVTLLVTDRDGIVFSPVYCWSALVIVPFSPQSSVMMHECIGLLGPTGVGPELFCFRQFRSPTVCPQSVAMILAMIPQCLSPCLCLFLPFPDYVFSL